MVGWAHLFLDKVAAISQTTFSNVFFFLVLPIDIENPYRLSNCLYRYISGSWQLIFSDLYRNLPGGR